MAGTREPARVWEVQIERGREINTTQTLLKQQFYGSNLRWKYLRAERITTVFFFIILNSTFEKEIEECAGFFVCISLYIIKWLNRNDWANGNSKFCIQNIPFLCKSISFRGVFFAFSTLKEKKKQKIRRQSLFLSQSCCEYAKARLVGCDLAGRPQQKKKKKDLANILI